MKNLSKVEIKQQMHTSATLDVTNFREVQSVRAESRTLNLGYVKITLLQQIILL